MIIRLKDYKIAYKLIFSFVLILFIVFLNCSTVSAATIFSGSLPYSVPNSSGLNSGIDKNAVLNLFNNSFLPNIRQFYPNVDFSNCLFYIIDAPNINNGNISIYILVDPQPDLTINSDAIYNNFDLQAQAITFTHTSRIFTINTNINTYNYNGSNQYDGRVNLFGNQSTIIRDSGNYTINYPFLMIGNDNIYDLSGNYVIVTNNAPYSPNVPTQGHATQPTNNPNNFINGSNGQPITRPTQPTINNYNWTTYNAPPIDTTSLESLVESLIDNVVYGFEYLKDNLQGEFSNLINNIQSLINYVVLSLENGFNKVIQAIQDIMTDLYNNFVSLFEPITEQLAYITQPFDSSNFESQLNNTSAMNILNVCNTSFDTFKSTFSNVSEPESYILQLDFNMPSSPFLSSYIVDGEINFNWLIPLKSVYRPLLWILFIAFAFISILTNIGNYLKGFSGGSDG